MPGGRADAPDHHDDGAEVIVLAGGLGTRMAPRTRVTPKVLLPVAGRPFARWLLERLAASGFSRAVLAVGHLAGDVRRALGDRAEGVALVYADDGPSPLGTGGAVKRALPLLARAFVVTYGDSFLPFDYRAPLADLAAHPEALGTMAVYENAGRFDRSNTEVAGERVVRYDKARVDDPALRFIDYGATALCREAFAALPDGPFGLDALQAELARRGALRALVARERFYEIGSPEGLADLERHLGGGA
ncbi:MAG TPA: NTP transferase domain-containing protein [Minicystis sp.]|nr:NTP transferase domain-containing protein [Minicystis sp.]